MAELSAAVPHHFVSIVICTYNRVESLRATLDALEALEAEDFDHEWIVVDNNSNDGTAAFLQDYARTHCRLRHLHEPRQGKSYALNCGIGAARGDIIAFTDDDVRPAATWLTNMIRVYDRYGAVGVGGPVLLQDQIPLPPWIHRSLVPLLGLKDLGNQLVAVCPPEALVGANMSVQKTVADEIGGFNTLLGPQGRNAAVAYSEDNDFCYRIGQARGCEKLLYSPDVVTYHAMMPGKLTPGYFRQRARGEAKAAVRMESLESAANIGQRLVQMATFSLSVGRRWIKHVGQADERFLCEFEFIREWTAFIERTRLALIHLFGRS